MPTSSHQRLRRNRRDAIRTGFCHEESDFVSLISNRRKLAIVMEGDSWFSYPKKYIVAGRPRNISDWVEDHISKKRYAYCLCLASVGDTAVQIFNPPGCIKLNRIIKRHGKKLDVLLLSAGGNDIVGKPLDNFINYYQENFQAYDCINWATYREKLKEIKSFYKKLAELSSIYAPKAKLFVQVYDYLKPEDRGFKLFSYTILGPWVYRYLEEKGYGDDQQSELRELIVIELLNAFKKDMLKLQEEFKNFFVINTHGSLPVGNHEYWADEMHPTTAGFKLLTRKIVSGINAIDPRVPKFD